MSMEFGTLKISPVMHGIIWITFYTCIVLLHLFAVLFPTIVQVLDMAACTFQIRLEHTTLKYWTTML